MSKCKYLHRHLISRSPIAIKKLQNVILDMSFIAISYTYTHINNSDSIFTMIFILTRSPIAILKRNYNISSSYPFLAWHIYSVYQNKQNRQGICNFVWYTKVPTGTLKPHVSSIQ